jgi:hypothetical protein
MSHISELFELDKKYVDACTALNRARSEQGETIEERTFIANNIQLSAQKVAKYKRMIARLERRM